MDWPVFIGMLVWATLVFALVYWITSRWWSR